MPRRLEHGGLCEMYYDADHQPSKVLHVWPMTSSCWPEPKGYLPHANAVEVRR